MYCVDGNVGEIACIPRRPAVVVVGADLTGVAGACFVAMAIERRFLTDFSASFSPGNRSMYFCATVRFP